MLVFLGKGKTGVPGEKPLGAKTRTNNKLNQHMTPSPGIEPPGHIGGRRVLSPLHHPCSPRKEKAANPDEGKAKAAKQIIAPLPKIRLKMALVCANSSRLHRIICDRTGKGQEEDQALPILIDMFAVTSVYLEMAYGLDTGSFLNAFFHMTNRRGLPERTMGVIL